MIINFRVSFNTNWGGAKQVYLYAVGSNVTMRGTML